MPNSKQQNVFGKLNGQDVVIDRLPTLEIEDIPMPDAPGCYKPGKQRWLPIRLIFPDVIDLPDGSHISFLAGEHEYLLLNARFRDGIITYESVRLKQFSDRTAYVRIGPTYVHFTSLMTALYEHLATGVPGQFAEMDALKLEGFARIIRGLNEQVKKGK